MVLAAQFVLSTLAAYVFARYRFRGRDVLFMLVLLPLMIMPDVLTVGLQVFASTDQGIDRSIITAATLLSAAPPLVALRLFQRQFVQSFMRAGIR